MTEIKRYGHDHLGELVQMGDGHVVYFEDHAAIVAALQEQVRALAAENAAFINDYRNTHDLRRMGIPATTATDAAIREIQAQAVEGFADCIPFYYSSAKQIARYYAARIRAGEQS